MCLDDLEKATEKVERLEFCEAQVEKLPEFAKSSMEKLCEDTVTTDFSQIMSFELRIRSGEWSHIGGRDYMEDTHVCISDLAKNYGCNSIEGEAISFFGVFDGHGGKDAAYFVRDNLPRVIVEDADFPHELEKAVSRSFVQIDTQFAKKCLLQSSLSSGTTALTAMIFGRSLLVANAGDCRAILSRHGSAVEMSCDHRPCCIHERKRVESLGGYIDDGYLNGLLAVTRALGDWHLEGLKNQNQDDSSTGSGPGPLSAEPELKLITLTKEDEFLIIASDGIWDFFSNQNAVDFMRRRLQEHNDVKLSCKEFVEEAIRRGATDNLTVVLVCFHLEPPPVLRVQRSSRVMRSISADGLHNLRVLLEGK